MPSGGSRAGAGRPKSSTKVRVDALTVEAETAAWVKKYGRAAAARLLDEAVRRWYHEGLIDGTLSTAAKG